MFTPATAAEAARRSHAPGSQRNSLRQAAELQNFCYQLARGICAGPSLPVKSSREDALALAGLVKAWDAMANRIRILRGIPMPGSRRPQEKAERRRKPLNLPPDFSSHLGQTMQPASREEFEGGG